jgi:RHS repeat-associated protein
MLGAPTVLIGGFPCPNLPNPLDALMHGLKCLGKAIGKSKGFGKILKKVGLCNSPGEPINPFTGEVYNDFEDYRDHETGFVWERHYRSGWNEQDGPLGFGFRHFYDRRLTFYRKRAIYETHDNESVALAKLEDGGYAAIDGFRLTSLANNRFQLDTDRDEVLDFELLATSPAAARLVRYRCGELDIHLFYDTAARLRALSQYASQGTIDTHFVYDEHRRIEQVLRSARSQPPIIVSRYKYADGCIAEWHDALGAAAQMRYDGSRRLVQGTDRRGYNFYWQFDASTGRCVSSRGEDGVLGVTASYAGTQSTFVESDGGEWRFKHYPDGSVSHVVDPYGGVKEYARDDTGRITKQIEPSGEEYLWLYEPSGKHSARRDRWGNEIPPEDELPAPPNPLRHAGPTTQKGWLVGEVLCPKSIRLSSLPDALANRVDLEQTRMAGARVARNSRDLLGRELERFYENGAAERFAYDPEGNLTHHQNSSGGWLARRIGSWNLIEVEQTSEGSVIQYGYTHRRKRCAVTDANGNRFDYERDLRQYVVRVTHNGAQYVRYERGIHGRIVAEYDERDAPLVRYNTDPTGLPLKATLTSGEVYTYARDEDGNLTDASSRDCRIERSFLVSLPLADKRDGLGTAHEYDDKLALRRTVQLETHVTNYDCSDPGVVVVSTPDGGKHRFWWQAGYVLVRENGNGTSELSVFDAQERVAAKLCWRSQSGEPSDATSYDYSPFGELTSINDSALGTTSYAYDTDRRLISQTTGRDTRRYAYDAANNLTQTPSHEVIVRGPGNIVRHTNRERFEYDNRGRVFRRITTAGTWTSYHYDSRDQLTEVKFGDRQEIWRAAYDGIGRRLWREYGGKRTEFYWDGDRLSAELAPDGALRLYVYASENSLIPFMWLDYTSSSAAPNSGQACYVFTAPTGMPTRVEDAQGQVVWRATTVDAYGHIDECKGQIETPRIRFAGHYYDEHLDLHYNRFRDYDPKLGRYLQIDPLGHGGSRNLYAYPSNPLVDVDLRGLMHKATGSGTGNGSENDDGSTKPPQSPEEAAAQKKKAQLEAIEKRKAERQRKIEADEHQKHIDENTERRARGDFDSMDADDRAFLADDRNLARASDPDKAINPNTAKNPGSPVDEARAMDHAEKTGQLNPPVGRSVRPGADVKTGEGDNEQHHSMKSVNDKDHAGSQKRATDEIDKMAKQRRRDEEPHGVIVDLRNSPDPAGDKARMQSHADETNRQLGQEGKKPVQVQFIDP